MITRLKRHDLHPDLIIAADEEIAKRNVSNQELEEYERAENHEIRRAHDLAIKNKDRQKQTYLGMGLLGFSFFLFLSFYLMLLGLAIYALGVYFMLRSRLKTLHKMIWISAPILLYFIYVFAVYDFY